MTSEQTPPGGAPGAPKRVLVVDDDEGIRSFLIASLRDEGYEVRAVESGRAALHVLTEWAPHAIMLDLFMPELDGWAFREAQLSLGDPIAAIPVLVMSASRSLRTRAVEFSAATIEKPFDLDALLETLARIIED